MGENEQKQGKEHRTLQEYFVYAVFIIFFSFLVLGVLSGIAKADQIMNGTDLINNPWDTIFSPFTDRFESIVGNGSLFWLFPVCILSIGVYIKTEDSIATSMFMLVTGALLFSGSTFIGASDMSVVFIIFIAMGLTSLFLSFLLQRRIA